MQYLGDLALGSTFDMKFVTAAAATGAPTSLTTGTVAAYPDNSTTEITAGLTLTADFDTRTGLNNVRVVASSGNGFASGSNYALVLTAGTVGGTSVVGYVVGHFSIEARSGLRPATAGRTLVVDAAGLADANAVKVGPTGAGTAQTARDLGASVLLSSGTGTGQVSLSAGVVAANVMQYGGVAGTFSAGRPEVNVTYFGGTAGTFAAGIPDTNAASLKTQAKTDVNNEVLDVMSVDTLTEPTAAAPPLTPTHRQIVNYMYRFLIRNTKKIDASTSPAVETIYADDTTTPIFKRNISDASNVTTFDKTISG